MTLTENHYDGGPQYAGFDNYYITRRILEYCQMTDQHVEDFIEGLNQDEADWHINHYSRDKSSSPDTIN